MVKSEKAKIHYKGSVGSMAPGSDAYEYLCCDVNIYQLAM